MIFRHKAVIVVNMKATVNLERKVQAFVEKHHMLSPGDRVIAGISGGADSVCLLFVLLQLSKELAFKVHVVHVNHGIRAEAGEDAAYVQTLCRQYDLPFTLVEADVRTRADREKRSEEETGRLVRYEAFEKVCAQVGGTKIAVAHNANDQAETMLFHLFRGSGLSGMGGIRPVRDRIIRPLLCVERREIEAYLSEKQISYCHDVTNEADEYVRNRIRHHILPYAEEQIAQGCVGHMVQTAEMLQETEDLLKRLTEQAYEKILIKNKKNCRNAVTNVDIETYTIQREQFRELDPVIGRRLIHRVLQELSPGGRDISYGHVQAVEALFEREGNAGVDLIGGIRAVRQYGAVYLERSGRSGQDTDSSQEAGGAQTGSAQAGPAEAAEILLSREALVRGPVSVLLPDGSELVLQVLPVVEGGLDQGEICQNFPQNRYTKWLDYDKMESALTIRTRRAGDYLTIRDAEGQLRHKPLKAYLITEKIPAKEREQIAVIAEDNHILWLTGYRISEYYKVGRNTKRILQVQLRRSREDGEREENNG